MSSFKLYCIRTFLKSDKNLQCEVLRRYSDFDWLKEKLIERFPGVSIPDLPGKDFIGRYIYETQTFNHTRRRGLEIFLTRVLTHMQFRSSEDFQAFLFYEKKKFSIYKDKTTKEMQVGTNLITKVSLSERVKHFISSTISRPPT